MVSRLGSAQRSRGHEVQVVSYASPQGRPRIEAMLDAVPGDRPDVHLLEPGGRLERLRATRARRWLADHVGSFDVVHLHGAWDPILTAAARVAVANGIPHLVTPHGMLDPWCLGQGRFKKRLALRTWVGSLLSNARFIHALNSDESTLMAPWIHGTAVETIPNGVFLEELEPLPDPGSFRSAHPELGDDPFILFLSRLHYKKGLDILLQAFEDLSNRLEHARLVIAGPDDGYESTLRTLIDRSPAKQRVHLVGPVYGTDKLAALVDAACFCLPSRQEGFSMAITEALACGSPVVITDHCHFPEVAGSGAGRVVPLDAPAVAGALEEVLLDPALCESMGQAGRNMVQQSYTWPAIAERFDAAFAANGITGSSA